MFTPELIKEFQQAIKKDYGEDVSFDDAGKILTGWVGYFDKLAEMNHKILGEENKVTSDKTIK